MTKTMADKRLPSTDSVVTLLRWVERHMSTRSILFWVLFEVFFI